MQSNSQSSTNGIGISSNSQLNKAAGEHPEIIQPTNKQTNSKPNGQTKNISFKPDEQLSQEIVSNSVQQKVYVYTTSAAQPGFQMQLQNQSQQPGFQMQPQNQTQQPGFQMQPQNQSQQPGFQMQPQNQSQQPGFQMQPQYQSQPGFQMQQVYQPQPQFIPPLKWIVPGVPPGFELLIPLHHIFVKQRIEMLEAIAGIETANSYDVIGMNGQRIYVAKELNDFVSLQCYGGSSRPFVINILDFFGRPILILDRPYEPCAGGHLSIKLPNGELLGQVVQLNCCAPEFDIMDKTGVRIMTITGPPGADCCSGGADYPIRMISGVEIGCIRKTFAGFIQEWTTDADNFGVEFPVDIDINWKILMFGAVFLIDFLYYESSPHRNSMHHRRHGFHHHGLNSF